MASMTLRFRKSISLLMLVAWPVAMLVASVSHDHAHSHGEAECPDAVASSTHDHDHAHHHGHSHGSEDHHHSHDGCHSHHDDAVMAEHSCDHPSEPLPHDHDCESCRFLGIPAMSIAVTVPSQIPEVLEFRAVSEPTPVFLIPTSQVAVRGPPVA